MARLKRYELYEGDGEIIPEEYVPLQDRQEKREEKPVRKPAEEPRNRYFAHRENDGLGPVSPLFDDFDRFSNQSDPGRSTRKKEPKHYNGGWIAVIVCCLIVLAGLGIMMVKKMSDSVSYRRTHNRNILVVKRTSRVGKQQDKVV